MTSFLIVLAILTEGLGGISILIGYKTKWGALALIIFIIVATLAFHLDFSDQNQILQLMKNLAIIGGLVLLLHHGAGPISLDNRKKQS